MIIILFSRIIVFAQNIPLPHSDSLFLDSLSVNNYTDGTNEVDSVFPLLYLRQSQYPFFTNRLQITERLDYEYGLVFYEIYEDGLYRGVLEVIPLSDYFKRTLYKELLTKSKEQTQRKAVPTQQPFDRMGLIPDIELP
ncbi:MAG: hypothetical protein N2748_03980, partial [candidate division WOR-3 bacterium]|nr:hypothetical protein [candidate division WOR-3 bacterium]